MAFVSASPKNINFINKTSSAMIGPGQYDVDSSQHKQIMSILRPKKNAPFNATTGRGLLANKSSKTPGPGEYESKVGIFEKQ